MSTVRANHMQGGELTWQCVGKDSFLITLTVYRDCNGVSLSSACISVKCKSTGSTLTALCIPRPTPVDITPTCPSSCTRCETRSCTFPYGIEQYTYQKLVYLGSNIPSSCCEVVMSYSMCCRNNTITTGAASKNFYIEATLNRCVEPCNNSPVFTTPPMAVICMGENFIFNYGALDADVNPESGEPLDSLGYEWSYPLSASGSSISYTGQYDYDKPIYFWGFPNTTLPAPRGFHLDVLTGDIVFRPMKVEQTVMVLTVKEYRYDSSQKQRVLIGQISRDISVVVINCTSNSPPILGGSSYREVCAGEELKMSIYTNDYDVGDTLQISWNGAIPDGIWTDNNGEVAHPTGIFTWTPSIEDMSDIPYTFIVTVKDDACPISGIASMAYQVYVKPSVQLDADVVNDGCGQVTFVDRKADPSSVCTWTVEGSSYRGDLVHYQFETFGEFPYSVNKTNSICSVSYQDTIRIDSFVQLQKMPEQKVCPQDSITLHLKYHYNKGPVWGIWDGVVGVHSKRYLINCDTQIIYACIDSTTGCMDYDTVSINMLEPAQVDLGSDVRLCSGDSQIITPKITIKDVNLGFTYWLWPEQGKADTVLTYPIRDSGIYICFFEDTFGCIGSDTLKVKISPPLVAQATDQNICQGDTVFLTADQTGSKTSNVVYSWYYNNALLGTGRSFPVVPHVNSTYKLRVSEIIDHVTCQHSSQVNVTIFAPSVTFSSIDERCVSGPNSSKLNLNNYITTTPVNTLKDWSYWPDPNAIQNGVFDPFTAGVGSHMVKVKVTDSSSSCVHFDSVYVKINPLPQVDAGMDDTLCMEDGRKLLKGTPSIPSGSWLNYGSHLGIDSSNGKWRFDPKASGIVDGNAYGIIYSYTDLNGCQNFDTAYIVVIANPTVNAGIYDTFCTYNIEKSLSGMPANGAWYGDGIVSNSFNPYLAGKGEHSLVYEVWNKGCVGRDTTLVKVVDAPVADFKPLAITQGIDYAVRFYDLSKGSNIGIWLWSFGDGDSSDLKHPLHIYPEAGDYKVGLVVKDFTGCVDTHQMFIHVEKKTVGLEEESDHAVFVYPNPFENQIDIMSSQLISEVEVYNMLGDCINVYTGFNANEAKIDLSGNRSGMLILKIHFLDQTIISQLVVKK